MKGTPKKKVRSSGDWKPAFLETLRETGNVKFSCRQAGIARSKVYDARDKDEAFRQAWTDALNEALDQLEGVAFERARESSDTLLIFLLKSHRPERYMEKTRSEITGKDGEPINLTLADLVKRVAESSKTDESTTGSGSR